MKRPSISILALLTLIGLPVVGIAQMMPPSTPSYGGAMPESAELVPGIAWYGVLEDGIAESKRSGKPIFFITAAPQCGGVPGMW
ncbi:MAG: hypothetical protein AAF191_04455 [Verrucomicrobiota bacterium]